MTNIINGISDAAFVTARVITENGCDTRQGWLIRKGVMIGESGALYAVKDSISIVCDPPEQMSYAAEVTEALISENKEIQ